MKFTGERYIPSEKGIIRYEHLHRYALARSLAAGKRVLDIASGEGYGSAMLAEVAHDVVGVDIDRESVAHATQSYAQASHPNTRFVVGSCDAVPLPDDSFDLIVSFETIEHHDHHEEMMGEMKRLLKADGVLVLSSPNRPTFNRLLPAPNHFHLHEVDRQELTQLLLRYFRYAKIFGQQTFAGSFTIALDRNALSQIQCLSPDGIPLVPPPAPTFFVAICSDSIESLPHLTDSALIDWDDDVIVGMFTRHLQIQKYMSAEIESLRHELLAITHLKIWKLASHYWSWRDHMGRWLKRT